MCNTCYSIKGKHFIEFKGEDSIIFGYFSFYLSLLRLRKTSSSNTDSKSQIRCNIQSLNPNLLDVSLKKVMKALCVKVLCNYEFVSSLE